MIPTIDWGKHVVCFNGMAVLLSISDVAKDMYYFHWHVRSITWIWLAVQVAGFVAVLVVYQAQNKAS